MAVNFDAVLNLSKAGLINPEQMGYKDSLEIIKDESYKVQKSFVKIGWYLKHIRDNELYKEDGYSTIYECAADQLGYSQSTVSRFVNICEKFSKNHNSPELDEKYAGFDKSQMIEMLPMEQEQIEKVKPDMTVKQIRDIKTGRKTERNASEEGEECEENSISGQMSIEEDFPEYMPSYSKAVVPGADDTGEEFATNQYATSHIDGTTTETTDIMNGDVVDGEYREIEEQEEVAIPQSEDMQEKEETDAETQQELPMLKNNDERKQWLNNYRAWGIWYRDENIDVNYYKFDFFDGSRLIVSEYPQRQSFYGSNPNDEYFYHLLEKNRKRYGKKYDAKYCNQTDSETYLVEFLKNIQKR